MPQRPFGRWHISPQGVVCGHHCYILMLAPKSLAYLLTRGSFQRRWYTGEQLLN